MVEKTYTPRAIIALIGLGLVTPAGLAFAQQGGIAAEQSPAPRAIQCSAALELMARAAPNWSNQLVAQQARYYWRTEADRLAQAAGRNANTEIGQEMGLLAEQAVYNPNALSDQATLCLSDVPAPGAVSQTPVTQAPAPAQQASVQSQPAQTQTSSSEDTSNKRRFGIFGRR